MNLSQSEEAAAFRARQVAEQAQPGELLKELHGMESEALRKHLILTLTIPRIGGPAEIPPRARG